MRALVVSSLLLALASPSLAGGADTLSGVWQGSLSCKTADDGGKAKLSTGPSLLLINQVGPGAPLDMNFVAKGFGGYSGRALPFAAKPNEGSGAFIACGTSDATAPDLYNEITTFQYKVDADGGGSLKTQGVFVLNNVQIGVCKGSWKRSSLIAKTAPCP